MSTMTPGPRPRAARNPWILPFRPVPRPRVRLFCLPFAGGSAGVYRAWADHLPLDVEVLGVQLPGRVRRRQHGAVKGRFPRGIIEDVNLPRIGTRDEALFAIPAEGGTDT